ncbi:unnamed protein product [Amoebophrya sp. A25]|nr:unnamed protein product [Amoebophrya sp. A25]|eukprot:GSA25T00027152001.1
MFVQAASILQSLFLAGTHPGRSPPTGIHLVDPVDSSGRGQGFGLSHSPADAEVARHDYQAPTSLTGGNFFPQIETRRTSHERCGLPCLFRSGGNLYGSVEYTRGC